MYQMRKRNLIILKVANVLIANNPHEFDKTLWSDLGMGEPLRLIRCANEEAEAERVATEILTQKIRKVNPIICIRFICLFVQKFLINGSRRHD